MNARQLTAALKVSTKALALAAAFALAAHAPAARAASNGQTPQQEQPPPRRPQGPVAGPVIKLPPGARAAGETAQPAAAASEESAREPRRWEYCVISGFRYHQKGLSLSSSSRTPSAVVRYFPNGSEEVEGATEEEALGNAFARLGDEGWELAAVRTDLKLREGDGETSTTYFFKRPKRQE